MSFQIGKVASGTSHKATKPASKKVFTPTEEQMACKDLVVSSDISAITAVSGSGKTTTFTYISSFLPEPSLYMTFNVTMAREAANKFGSHVTCMTTHSLAYRNIGKSYQHKLSRPYGKYVNVALTPAEVARFFRLPCFTVGEVEGISSNYLGLIVRDTVNTFEIGDTSIIDTKTIPNRHIKDLKEKYPFGFDLHKFNKFIVKHAKSLWQERIDKHSDVCCTHNTYLKLYQLSSPDLSKLYKVIYLDEAQDLNSVTRSIILQQQGRCKLVFTGDKYQQIYAWNGSVNALQSLRCPKLNLSKSFRFGPKVAKLAELVLEGEAKVEGFESLDTKVGIDVVETKLPHTIIFRTNMALIFEAVRLLNKGKNINVNVDMKDFVAMLKSVVALHQGNTRQVKHENIIPYSSWDELEEESLSGGELKRLVAIVKGGDSDRIIRLLHSQKNTDDALINLTTAHKAKGLEFKQVILASDFPSNYDKEGKYIGLAEEERNLLYVAVTRAMGALNINKTCEELYSISSSSSSNGLNKRVR